MTPRWCGCGRTGSPTAGSPTTWAAYGLAGARGGHAVPEADQHSRRRPRRDVRGHEAARALTALLASVRLAASLQAWLTRALSFVDHDADQVTELVIDEVTRWGTG